MSQDNGNNVGSPEFKKKLASLYSYLAKHLQVKEAPKITLTNSKKNSTTPFGLTGYYDHKTKTIRLYVTDRHETDILRSFAHEVIHHWQNENGTLHPEGEGADVQTHAHYAQDDQNLRKREMEAYLFGNILFRDWQDENRYGPPKTQPLMPQPINENLTIKNNDRVKEGIKKLIDHFIREGTISSYHRDLTSGDMNPADFSEDLANKLVSELNEIVQTINNRGDWENQEGGMIKEEDANWNRWVESMVGTVRDHLLETQQRTCDEYEAYDILKTDFRAEAPSHKMFEQAVKQAIDKLKASGLVK
jgi:hypothetical protein